jgi:hypothetical protein
MQLTKPYSMKKELSKFKIRNFVFILGALLILSSCAPSGPTDEPYGFLSGIWHGICIPFTIIGKIFGMDIGLHALNNTGTWYWVGMLIGIGIIGGSGGAAASKR